MVIKVRSQDAAYQTPLLDMLNDPTKKVGESKNFLTLLVRRYLFQTNMSFMNFSHLMERWLRRKYDKTTLDGVSKMATQRGNFSKEVCGDAITANVLQKFTEAMGATKVTVTLRMEFGDNREPVEVDASFTNATNYMDGDAAENANSRRDAVDITE